MRPDVLAYMYPGWRAPQGDVETRSVSEWDLVLDAKSYFPGHETLGMPLRGAYSVCDPDYLREIAELCSEYGIAAVVVCWYWEDGSDSQAAFLDSLRRHLGDAGVRYCLMWVQRRPHTVFPLELPPNGAAYHPEVENRKVVTSVPDLVSMGSYLRSHFDDDRYYRFDDRPVFVVFEVANLLRDLQSEQLPHGLSQFRRAARGEDGVLANPFILGVVHHVTDCFPLGRWGFDGATSYVYLPDWSDPSPESHEVAQEKRAAEWPEIEQNCGTRYFPSIAAGWDASPRGARLERLPPYYPWSPIILHSTPHSFASGLDQAIDWRRESRRMIFIASLNEWSEGHAVEPSIRFSFDYLATIRDSVRHQDVSSRDAPEFHTLLVTDVDGTATGSGAAAALRELALEGVGIVYVSARQLGDLARGVRSEELARPLLAIGDVGTTWWSLSAAIPPYHPLADQLRSFSAKRVRDALSHLPGLRLQDLKCMSRVSYFVDHAEVNRTEVEACVTLVPATCLWSRDYLDVLPVGVDKATCTKEIVRILEPDLLIVAGDSMNDTHVMASFGSVEVARIAVPSDDLEFLEWAGKSDVVTVAPQRGGRGLAAAVRSVLGDKL